MCIDGAAQQCGAFKDPIFYIAQAFLTAGVIVSFFGLGGWIALSILTIPYVILSTSWCCAMSKCGFITGGVCALILGVLAVLVGFTQINFFLALLSCPEGYQAEDYDLYYNDDFYSNNDFYSNYNQNQYNQNQYNQDQTGLGFLVGCIPGSYFTMTGIAGVLCVVSSVLFFVFTCCGKFDEIAAKLIQEKQAQAAAANPQAAYGHASPNGFPVAAGYPSPGVAPGVAPGYTLPPGTYGYTSHPGAAPHPTNAPPVPAATIEIDAEKGSDQ